MAPNEKLAGLLQSVEAAPTNDRPDGYEKLLEGLASSMTSSSTATQDFNAIADSFFNQSLGVVATRSIVNSFVETLQKAAGNEEVVIEAGQHLRNHLENQTSSYPDAVAAIIGLIAVAYESQEEFRLAAEILAEIPLETSQRKVTDSEKASIWVRIVRNFLEVDETVAAEGYINKLKNVMHEVEDEEIKLHFSLSLARILDSRRDFLTAAHRYHELSFSTAIAEEERLHTLSMATKCAILAPAGPQRSRTLARLHKDERSSQLPEFGILEKIFLDRLLQREEVEKFAEDLQPHQLATTADGSTVLAKAIMEHNLLGVSRLYSNINFESLGSLLGLDADKAEETTLRMIEQGRLVGRIDQIDRIVYFEGGEASGEKGSGRADIKVGNQIRKWDANVESLAQAVENITNALHQRFPVFVETTLGG